MRCLLDSSIFNALARYRLLDEAMAVRGVSKADLLVLKELKYQLIDNRDPLGRPILDTPTLNFARAYCAGISTISSTPAESEDRRLLSKKNDNLWHGVVRVKVDLGEAVLFAATKEMSQFSVWTADKKSLIALSKIPECGHVHARMVGRVFCLERIVRDLIEAHGYDVVAPKLCTSYHSVDKAIKAGADSCCTVLRAAEDELQEACRGLLAA